MLPLKHTALYLKMYEIEMFLLKHTTPSELVFKYELTMIIIKNDNNISRNGDHNLSMIPCGLFSNPWSRSLRRNASNS